MLPSEENKGIKNIFKNAEHKGAAVCFCCIALLVVSGASLSKLSITGRGIFAAIFAISAIAFVLPSAAFAAFTRKHSLVLFSKPAKSSSKLLFSGSFLLVFTALLIQIITYRISDQPQTTLGALLSDNGYFYALLCYAILPAVLEELLFRGIAFSLYEKSCGGLGAVIGTSLFFAMSHLSGREFFLYLAAGIILGFVVYITRSVFVTIVLHLINNIFSFYLENSVFRITAENKSGILAIFLLSGLFLLCLFWFLTDVEAICRKRYLSSPPMIAKKEDEKDPSFAGEEKLCPRLFPPKTDAKTLFSRLFMSPFLWTSAIIFVIYISVK